MMIASTPLPVGVVLPTRNVRAGLPRHLEAMERWLHRVQEIIVVDSESEDGTVEYLRERLHHPRIQFMAHPPGLYESWNAALRQLRAEWAYISTIGDTIPAATLEQLVELARWWEADVVVSAPHFVGPWAGRVRNPWPVQRLIQRWGLSEPCLLSGWEVFLWSALYVPGGMLGSSSSNVYRTRVLQEHPFPTCYGHAGDTGWAIENAFRARWVVAPGLESAFLKHAPANRRPRERPGATRRSLHERAREIFTERRVGVHPLVELAEWTEPMEAFWGAAGELLDANERYHTLRRASLVPFLHGSVWWARWKRFLSERRLERRRSEILRRADLRHRQRVKTGQQPKDPTPPENLPAEPGMPA